MTRTKWLVVVILAIALGLFFWFDGAQYLSLDYALAQRDAFSDYARQNPLQSGLIYFLIYVLVAALSLPGAAIMTLLGGAIFGLLWGSVLVSFASTLGATLALLVSRFLLRDVVQNRFADRLQSINAGVRKEGAYYLFTLRLVPVFPFFVINLLMGLVPIKVRTFAWVSQLGMLPATIVYVNAGTQLGELKSLSGILAPELLISFALLGLFPLLARKFLDWLTARHKLSKWVRPKSFDRNLIVIGAGSGGLVTSYIAAAVKAKVTLFEKHKMGGDCLNTGCVPSKALIRTSRLLSDIRNANKFGLDDLEVDVDFPKVMRRVQEVISNVEPHDSIERYQSLGVEVVQAEAFLESPWTVRANGNTLTARNIVIATGGRPAIPEIPGCDAVPYVTSDTIWSLTQCPKHLLVMGGGPIGCELAQCFAQLGSEVTIVIRSERILPKEDIAVSDVISQRFIEQGICIVNHAQAKQFSQEDGDAALAYARNNEAASISFDVVLFAIGRKANTENVGLEALGVDLNPNGTIACDQWMRTSIPTILACGDVAGPHQLTHAAAHQAWYASVNALFGQFKKFSVDYSALPHCTFTSPEVARVGLNEIEAKANDIEYEVTRFDLDELDRAIADSVREGFIQVLTVPGKDKILGVTIVAEHAGEMIPEYVTAMRYKLGLNKILGTIHAYPTFSEANKYVAGEWKRQHAPEKLLRWVERFHQWRRS